MAKGESVGLTLPPQSNTDNSTFDIRANKLAGWVKALPIGNIGETTRLLYQALRDVNTHTYGWKQRYHFLEAIRAPLHLVQQAITKRYTGQGFPLPAKTHQIALLSQHLYTEMAIGYKAAMIDMLASMFLFQDRGALKTMVHRCVRYLSQSILTSYQIYSQQHSGAWQELHHLYIFAMERRIHQDQVNDPFITELPESSIARLYKQIVLLAAASPFRLRQGEAVAIYHALARWSAHVKLHEANSNEAHEALFVIHLADDAEPNYATFDPRPCEPGSCLLIDTRQLLKILEEERKHTVEKIGSAMTPDLIKRLVDIWSHPPKRSSKRQEGEQGVAVVVGMTRIHNLLAPSLHDALLEAHPAHFEGHALRTQEKYNSANDIWNVYAAKKPSAAKATTVKPSNEPPPSADIQSWEVRNESPGGYRLAIPDNQGTGIRVGEVLALRNESDKEQWQPAVVRWIRYFPHTGIEAGVQVLAPQMIAIMVKNLAQGKDKSEYQRGLLLPTVELLKQHATLILPTRMFLPNEPVMLHTSSNELEVVLGELIEDSSIFVHFEFNTGDKNETATEETGEPDNGSTDFSALWKQL